MPFFQIFSFNFYLNSTFFPVSPFTSTSMIPHEVNTVESRPHLKPIKTWSKAVQIYLESTQVFTKTYERRSFDTEGSSQTNNYKVLSDGSKIIFSYSLQRFFGNYVRIFRHFYQALKKEVFNPDELCCQYLLEWLKIWALKKELLHPDELCCQYLLEWLNIWALKKELLQPDAFIMLSIPPWMLEYLNVGNSVQCLQWADINYHAFDKSSLYRYFLKCSLKQQSAGYHWFFLLAPLLLFSY